MAVSLLSGPLQHGVRFSLGLPLTPKRGTPQKNKHIQRQRLRTSRFLRSAGRVATSKSHGSHEEQRLRQLEAQSLASAMARMSRERDVGVWRSEARRGRVPPCPSPEFRSSWWLEGSRYGAGGIQICSWGGAEEFCKDVEEVRLTVDLIFISQPVDS